MGDMKDKMKDLMKKVNNPFSSSSGKFKGQGRVLGSSSSGPTNPILARPVHLGNSSSSSNPRSGNSSNSTKSSSQKVPTSDRPAANSSEKRVTSPQKATSSERMGCSSPENHSASVPNQPPKDGFDPFDSLITTGKRNKNGFSLNNVFECPVCNGAFSSEEEVSIHIESCVSNPSVNGGDGFVMGAEDENRSKLEISSRLEACVGAYLSGKPSEGSIDVILRLLRNVLKEPVNAKFRKIRMSNPKIREAIGDVAGAVELLECVGFQLKEEDGEMWGVMDVPSEENIFVLKKSISLIESQGMQDSTSSVSDKVNEKAEAESVTEASNKPVQPKVIDRQIRVFFSVPESVAARIELPDSFYNLSLHEVKREAELRKKKRDESQLLIPKSYKERQAKAARRKYNRAVIRVQFPDGVVLQAVFCPWEPTSILYEIVSSALKQPGLEFELMHPIPVKRRVIPCFPRAGERASTLEEEDLVPSALVKFKPLETDSLVFTGLRNELLEISEPLVSNSQQT